MGTAGSIIGLFSFIIIGIVILLILASCIRIVPQAQAIVLERLGAYRDTWSVGIHFKLPIIDRVAKRVILKEQVVDFAPQPVITKDNVTMRIDTVAVSYTHLDVYKRQGQQLADDLVLRPRQPHLAVGHVPLGKFVGIFRHVLWL